MQPVARLLDMRIRKVPTRESIDLYPMFHSLKQVIEKVWTWRHSFLRGTRPTVEKGELRPYMISVLYAKQLINKRFHPLQRICVALFKMEFYSCRAICPRLKNIRFSN